MKKEPGIFELPELKLFVDAVQSSKFITEKKSGELIRKLESQCSQHEAEQLQRQVFIYNRVKAENETIYYNIDRIHTAIYQNREVRYQYCEWSPKKELVLRRNDAFYEISPWALLWDDENYYMIGFDEKSSRIKHYRVDKMRNLGIMEEERQGRVYFEGFDLAAFAKKTFGMFGGSIDKGNTEIIAEKLQELTGAELFQIQQKVPYSDNYKECVSQSREDLKNNARSELIALPEEKFDVLYLGFPNYCGTMPMAVFTFLESVCTEGVTIKPFCTNEGSGMGQSIEDMKKICPKAKIEAGLSVHGRDYDETAMKAWL